MSAARRVPHRLAIAFVAVTAAAVAAPVLAAQQLVVVRKTGQTSTHTLPAGAKATASGAAVCADDSVAFAFLVEPRGATTIELQRGTDSGRDIVIDVTLTCSTLTGTALVPFDARPGSAVSGRDYLATPGSALLDLTAATHGSPPPVPATVRIDVLDSGEAGTSALTLSIVRRDGSFQGQWPDGTPTVGVIPGSNEALVSITILQQVTIRDGAELVPGIDPAADEISRPTTTFCRPGNGGAGSVGCTSTQRAANLIVAPNTPANVREAAMRVIENNLLAIAPDETTALAFVAPRIAMGQRDNLAQRLSAMRAGAAPGFSADGLLLRGQGVPISLSALPGVLHADDESAANEEKRTLLGGTRLGLWINGTIGRGERDRNSASAGFESDLHEVTAGVDYRFTDQLFAGFALGFSRFDADFDRDQGSLEGDARSLHVYGGYALANGLAFDGSLGAIRSDYSQRRVIELYALDAAGTGFTSLGRDVARGNLDVDQLNASFGATWTIMRQAWTIAPQAQLTLTRTDYGRFTERGPSAFNLSYAQRDANGRSFSFGSYFDRTFATSVGAFRPYVRALYHADSGSVKDLAASFAQSNDDGTNTVINLSMDRPDQRYGSAELGVGFSRPIGTRTVDFNAGYLQMFGFDGWDRRALRFDVRVPL